ncbi:MAG: RsiV family protein [Bacteroidales bacterium]|nr:RsiV family protein [Bacteroidales bacterium]
MSTKTLVPFIGLIITLLSSGCGNIAKKALHPQDTVGIASTQVTDNSSFKKSNGEQCKISINANIAYPKAYKDSADTRKLQQLFTTVLLDVPGDSVNLQDAMHEYAAAYLDQNAPTADDEDVQNDESEGGDDYDAVSVVSYNATINITPIFNKDGILTFCKEEIIKKNNRVTLKTHHYYNIDLEAMAQIAVNRIFKSSSLNDVCQLMKDKLMSQNNVKSEDELNDLGYYNLPNLSVSNNFFFTDKGITWSFEPNELAINAIGEPQISLDFSSLKPYFLENSIINNL